MSNSTESLKKFAETKELLQKVFGKRFKYINYSDTQIVLKITARNQLDTILVGMAEEILEHFCDKAEYNVGEIIYFL